MTMRWFVAQDKAQDKMKLMIIFSDGSPRSVMNDHPSFGELRQACLDNKSEQEIKDILDKEQNTLRDKLGEVLTDRISVENGHIMVDGRAVHNTLGNHILAMMKKGDKNYINVARFYENLMQNPSEYAREQLYDWLTAVGMFALDSRGYVLGYKGVTHDDMSRRSGYAYVQGNLVRGAIPYRNEEVVTMRREDVEDNPDVACSTGLHIGTYEYAKNWGSKVKLVAFNPRDVVSVPRDHFQKLRVCRLASLEDTVDPYGYTSFNEDDKYAGYYEEEWDDPSDFEQRTWDYHDSW